MYVYVCVYVCMHVCMYVCNYVTKIELTKSTKCPFVLRLATPAGGGINMYGRPWRLCNGWAQDNGLIGFLGRCMISP